MRGGAFTDGRLKLYGKQSRSLRTVPLPARASLIIEVNGTAGDAGLQFFLDGEPGTR